MRTHRYQSQHQKAEARLLENERTRLVRRLAEINRQLRTPHAVVESDDWDFDPRGATL